MKGGQRHEGDDDATPRDHAPTPRLFYLLTVSAPAGGLLCTPTCRAVTAPGELCRGHPKSGNETGHEKHAWSTRQDQSLGHPERDSLGATDRQGSANRCPSGARTRSFGYT